MQNKCKKKDEQNVFLKNRFISPSVYFKDILHCIKYLYCIIYYACEYFTYI